MASGGQNKKLQVPAMSSQLSASLRDAISDSKCGDGRKIFINYLLRIRSLIIIGK